MKIVSINGSLIMESKGGPAEINCITSLSGYTIYDLEKLREALQPLSGASLVLLDGLVFNGCPVPILIEEALNVVIQNCVFQWVFSLVCWQINCITQNLCINHESVLQTLPVL